jgi:hypothetical protein
MFLRKLLQTLPAALLVFGIGTAQTQLVLGDVDTIQGTNQFRLDCTNILLVSNAVNLQQLHDQSRQQDIEYRMQVVDVTNGGPTTLNVISATAIPEQFGMGNLRFGRAETWETFAAPGSPVWTFVDLTSQTRYLPIGPAGTWVLGQFAALMASGVTSPIGRFQFRFTMPNIPELIGTSFSAQSVVQENGVFRLTNPDCKTVRS